MAEVFAAFGAISGFLQVVDFTARLASTAVELVRSGRDALREDIALERLARECKAIGEQCSTISGLADQNGTECKIAQLGKDCQHEAEKLLKELQKLKLEACNTKIKRYVKGAQQAARALAHRKSIDIKRSRLQEHTNLLATHMLMDLWSRDQSISKCISNPGSYNAQNVDQVQAIVARKRIHSVLEGLRFPKMPRREKAIEIAWKQTYSWALENTSSGLASWLEDGHGLFWISGKAGSGKSTLMKYLCGHESTRGLLRKWSRDRRLVFVRYFFWYAGSRLQKSITGLLRSIPYQILFEIPSLAEAAFGQHDGPTDFDDATDEQLRCSLEAITLDPHGKLATSQTVFCFFIDGLDEYEGDHSRLTTLLLAFSNCSNIKLCVSSRPWNAFLRVFEHGIPSLQLEKLTRPDTERYTSDRIHKSISVNCGYTSSDARDPEGVESLIQDIVDRAEGVYLWIVLAVSSVCEGITEGDNITMLRYRVSRFPQGLDDFFRSILGRVDPAYIHQTYQALTLAWWNSSPNFDTKGTLRQQRSLVPFRYDLSRGDGLGRATDRPSPISSEHLQSFIDYWLIKQTPEGLADEEFAFQGDVTIIYHDSILRMRSETRTFLSAACKDLLCLPSRPVDHTGHGYLDDRTPRIEFLHRTVYDFLSTPEMAITLLQRTPNHFHTGRILHLLNLKRLKYVFNTDTLDVRLRKLQHSAGMSLPMPHEDLHKRYVDQFDYIANTYHCQNRNAGFDYLSASLATSAVMAPLIAFQQHRFVFAMLDMLYVDTGSKAQLHGTFRDQVWVAALGEDPENQFPLHEINLELVEKLLAQPPLAKAAVRSDDHDECCSTSWQRFLRRWKLSDAPSHLEPAAHADHWRHVWDIAKVFMKYGVTLSCRFCLVQDREPHDCGNETAAEYLVAHVPHAWLVECGDFV